MMELLQGETLSIGGMMKMDVEAWWKWKRM